MNLIPCKYRLPGDNKIFIEERIGRTGESTWAVTIGGNCVNRDGEQEFEPLPSARDTEFLARCRFDTLEAAVAVAELARS